MEIIPEKGARLTTEKYPEPFSGLRDVVLEGQPHHLHLDLARLRRAVYTVTPSVCYGYRPSFEVRFCGPSIDEEDQEPYAFACAVRRPYVGRATNRAEVTAYFSLMLDHLRRFRGVVEFRLGEPASAEQADGKRSETAAAWDDIYACLREACGDEQPSLAVEGPECLLREVRALMQRDEVAHDQR